MDNNGFTRLGISHEIDKVLQHVGYEALTEVQEKVIPTVIAAKDVIVKSQTGRGSIFDNEVPLLPGD